MGYVKKHFGDPEPMRLTPEHSKISAYFNIDNGTGAIRGIYLQGNTRARPTFASILSSLSDLGASTLTIKNVGSTDHMPFVSVGIPAFTFIQDPIDYETRIVVATVLYHVANLPELVPRMPLPAPRKR
jgi:hypothetical protein